MLEEAPTRNLSLTQGLLLQHLQMQRDTHQSICDVDVVSRLFKKKKAKVVAILRRRSLRPSLMIHNVSLDLSLLLEDVTKSTKHDMSRVALLKPKMDKLSTILIKMPVTRDNSASDTVRQERDFQSITTRQTLCMVRVLSINQPRQTTKCSQK